MLFLIKLKAIVNVPVTEILKNIAALSAGVSALSIGAVLGFLYHYFDIIKASPLKAENAANGVRFKNSTESNTARAMIEWFMDESPIVSPEQDTFNQCISARRVSELLRNEKAVSIGIVGGYGTGKSSFVNLTEYYLKNNGSNKVHLKTSNPEEEFVLCRVNGWGRVYGTVAKQILTEAIESVKQYVDCSSIISLPEQYRKAIAGTNSLGGSAISSLFQCSHDPESQLCRLNHILNAARIRLVIVLEDIDRNLDENIIQVEIPALLDRLRMQGSISFIFSIGTEQHYSNILARICNHVEAIS